MAGHLAGRGLIFAPRVRVAGWWARAPARSRKQAARPAGRAGYSLSGHSRPSPLPRRSSNPRRPPNRTARLIPLPPHRRSIAVLPRHRRPLHPPRCPRRRARRPSTRPRRQPPTFLRSTARAPRHMCLTPTARRLGNATASPPAETTVPHADRKCCHARLDTGRGDDGMSRVSPCAYVSPSSSPSLRRPDTWMCPIHWSLLHFVCVSSSLFSMSRLVAETQP